LGRAADLPDTHPYFYHPGARTQYILQRARKLALAVRRDINPGTGSLVSTWMDGWGEPAKSTTPYAAEDKAMFARESEDFFTYKRNVRRKTAMEDTPGSYYWAPHPWISYDGSVPDPNEYCGNVLDDPDNQFEGVPIFVGTNVHVGRNNDATTTARAKARLALYPASKDDHQYVRHANDLDRIKLHVGIGGRGVL
jgi:hypothetical protein